MNCLKRCRWWSQLAQIAAHHHHHLFLKRPFLPRSARVRCLPRYEASPHIPEHCPFRVQTKFIQIIFYTFSLSLPAPTHLLLPYHLHISTGRHPIISTLTLHMPKPPTTKPHHLSHALNTQKTVQDFTHFASYPSETHIHLTIIRSALFQAMQILSLHCPCLSPIRQHTLDTGPKNLSLHVIWCMYHGLSDGR